MTNIKIVDNEHQYVTNPASPDDRWDRDDTATEHNIRGFRVVDDQSYYDLSVGFEIDSTRPYFLVYAIYSTGDSFGHDEGLIEFVGLYQSLDIAHENVRRIEHHNEIYQQLNDRRYRSSKQMSKAELKKLEKNFNQFSVKLVTDDDKEFDVHVPWNGYFERLTSIDVEPVLAR